MTYDESRKERCKDKTLWTVPDHITPEFLLDNAELIATEEESLVSLYEYEGREYVDVCGTVLTREESLNIDYDMGDDNFNFDPEEHTPIWERMKND